MPKYEANISRVLTLCTTITVSAKTEQEAEAKAQRLAEAGVLTWEIDDKLDWEQEDDETTCEDVTEA